MRQHDCRTPPDPPHALVLLGSPADIGTDASWGMSTWQFVVNPSPNGASRLLARGRYDHADDWKSRLVLGRFPIEVGSLGLATHAPSGVPSSPSRSARGRPLADGTRFPD